MSDVPVCSTTKTIDRCLVISVHKDWLVTHIIARAIGNSYIKHAWKLIILQLPTHVLQYSTTNERTNELTN